MILKPILFNTDMVKAILDGRKTVTRRLVKPQPFVSCEGLENECKHETGFFDTGANHWACRKSGCGIMMNGKSIYHAPSQAGDILYVRETYANISDFVNYAEYELDSDLKYLYKCDDNGKEHSFIDVGVKRWRPSIHMPKEAARIFLKVADVRVERLQDMDQEDAIKEGLELQCHRVDDDCSAYLKCNFQNSAACLDSFKELWNSTISKKDPADMYKYGWKANPWVWVIEFERISKEDAYESNE